MPERDYTVDIKIPIRNQAPQKTPANNEPVFPEGMPKPASSESVYMGSESAAASSGSVYMGSESATANSESVSMGSKSVAASSESVSASGEPVRPHGPSRSECEAAIKRILITETLESGKNAHFKSSSDFMPYFEALYPAGPGLRKQVQRALKALDMPKDENGYYMVHKTREQAAEDEELSDLLEKSGASIAPANIEDPLQMLVLRLDKTSNTDMAYIAGRLARSVTLSGKFETMLPTTNGILVLTRDPAAFRKFLAELLPEAGNVSEGE